MLFHLSDGVQNEQHSRRAAHHSPSTKYTSQHCVLFGSQPKISLDINLGAKQWV
jgi:hypothetical protein